MLVCARDASGDYLCTRLGVHQTRERGETENRLGLIYDSTADSVIDSDTDLMQRGHSKSDTVRTPRVFSLWLRLSPATQRGARTTIGVKL